jgi:hypothetical protein
VKNPDLEKPGMLLVWHLSVVFPLQKKVIERPRYGRVEHQRDMQVV